MSERREAGNRVAIVTDSAAALPADLVARFGIVVVPMWLTIEGRPELEGTRPLAELLGEQTVFTSAPAPGEFEAAIKDALASADRVVVLTIARAMSATNEAARVGATGFGDRVTVIDTQTAAGAQALVVLAAAVTAASENATMDDVVVEARRVIDRVRLSATIPTLDHLVRSGRVPGVAAWAGKRLGINPLFEFRRGAVRRLRPALSSEAAADRMVAHIRRSRLPGARLHVVALHALAVPAATVLLERVVDEFDAVESFVGEFGPVMVVHTGPGLVGVAWWWDEAVAPG